MSRTKKPVGKLVTAIISWDPKIHGDFFLGTIFILYSSGMVWIRVAKEPREGAITFTKGRPRMTLMALKQDAKGNLEEMKRRFKGLSRFKDFDFVSPDLLEQLKKS